MPGCVTGGHIFLVQPKNAHKEVLQVGQSEVRKKQGHEKPKK